MYNLRPEQRKAVDYTLANLNKPVALALSTGFGKSFAAKALSDALQGRTAIVTYSNNLVGQYIREFPTTALIGSNHYMNQNDKFAAHSAAKRDKCVVFNPATYLLYLKKDGAVPFDNIIIDEADACLGLWRQLDPCTIPWTPGVVPSVETIVEHLIMDSRESFGHVFAAKQQNYWWEVTEYYSKKDKKVVCSLKIHSVILPKSFREKYFPKRVVLMSGTLFPSFVKELLGGEEYNYYEAPSPIPVERRLIYGLTQEDGWQFPSNYEQMLELLDVVLEKYQERPAVIHTTYADVANMKLIREHLQGYTDKSDKMIALEAIENTDQTLLTPGLIEGVDLKDNRARLNVILRGAFPNLGADSVFKRFNLPGGRQCYIESALRSAVQAAGRTTRGPNDFSTTVIADCRLTRLINENRHLLPAYFVEALRF